MIANLLTNAAKSTGRGGAITLAARREGGEAVVSVKDTGVGLPPDTLTKVFDMFTQVDTSLERSQGGRAGASRVTESGPARPGATGTWSSR